MTTDITVTKEGRHTTVSGLTYEDADAATMPRRKGRGF
jgi:hypothetical protein